MLRSGQPLLFLDVDGVLFPTLSMPPGYRRVESDTASVVVSDQHAVWLADLSRLFEIRWCTTWGDSANAVFAPLLGLDALPVVALDAGDPAQTRKLLAIQRESDGHPVAWMDDEIPDLARTWESERDEPTLLVSPRPSVGFAEIHYRTLSAFGAGLT